MGEKELNGWLHATKGIVLLSISKRIGKDCTDDASIRQKTFQRIERCGSSITSDRLNIPFVSSNRRRAHERSDRTGDISIRVRYEMSC